MIVMCWIGIGICIGIPLGWIIIGVAAVLFESDRGF